MDVGRGFLGRAGLRVVFVTVGRPLGKAENSLSIHTKVTRPSLPSRVTYIPGLLLIGCDTQGQLSDHLCRPWFPLLCSADETIAISERLKG